MYRNNQTIRKISVLGVILCLSVALFAQSSRVVKTRVAPSYPELARKMNVSGTVKVEVVVAPNGTVKSAKALGGHPLLVDAAVNAAKQCKFEAAGEETKEIIEYNFKSST